MEGRTAMEFISSLGKIVVHPEMTTEHRDLIRHKPGRQGMIDTRQEGVPPRMRWCNIQVDADEKLGTCFSKNIRLTKAGPQANGHN